MWSSEEEYEQLEYEWQEQLELFNELKDKPSELKQYEEKLLEATFNYNRAEGYSRKGKHNTAKTFYIKSESLCEDAHRYCKKFCTLTAVFAFGLIEILALKLVVT